MLVSWVVTVRSLVSEHFRSQVAIGAAISEADYKAALVERSRLVEAVCEWAAASDAILTPPAPGEAPGRETTGDPRLCARWTLVGAPAISVPAGRCSGGLPLGLQLCAAPGEDRALLGAAAWVERALAANRGKPGLT
jgi:Asp-tRNA(Asn)/Glu-tRNA(Gln) amidotransferase A subunit family amidase